MMDRETTYHHIEFVVAEWQPRSDVADSEADILKAALDAHPLGDLQRRFGEIDADYFARHFRKRHRDVTGPVAISSTRASGRGLTDLHQLLDVIDDRESSARRHNHWPAA